MKTDETAHAIYGVAHAITANAGMGHDATGAAVASLTEAVMGHTTAMVQIAEAIDRLAEAVERIADKT